MVVEPENSKPHVAILPSPGMGHVIPLFELGKRILLHHDVHVSFLVITTNEPCAAVDNLLCSPNLPSHLDIVELPPVDVFAVTTDDMLVVTRLSVIVKESLESLKSVLTELGKLQALVCDLFCTQAFDVCSDLSIPVYPFSTSSIAFLTLCCYIPALDREVEGEFVDLPEPVKVPGCHPIQTEDLFDQIKDRKNDEYKWCLFHFSRLHLASGILLNSWRDLEPVAFQALTENSFFRRIPVPPVYPIGPLIKQDETMTQTDVECLEWLDKQPRNSVLFVSLGSGGTLTAEQQAELAYGLELSKQRFILVVRRPTNSSASAAFFNVGSDSDDPKAYLPEGFSERTRERGLVIPSWAPQASVLKHPSTGGFLSHCGWNSTLESISYAVPVIAWPLYAEQRMNATILAEQVGVAMKPTVAEGKSIVEREEIRRVIKTVMEGEEGNIMRQKARELRESAAKALDIGGPSYESLALAVHQWTRQSLLSPACNQYSSG